MFCLFSYNQAVFTQSIINESLGMMQCVRSVQHVQGCFNGHCEPAVMVHMGYDLVPTMNKFVLHTLDQDAIVYVDNNFDGFMFTQGRGAVREDIGRWTKVSQADALLSDAYTRIGQEYYVIR